jgi:hypothetical protein
MSYPATAFNVMIASPSDVPAERSIARDMIAEWNAVNASRKRMIPMPVSWESHSHPEMGDRPQAIINRQLLKECDLVIGIFWTRIGTPTAEFASGTVEEIEEHIESGKPAMLYFSEAPVQPDSVDPDQYKALREFREECRSRGLYETYSDLNDFRAKLYRHIQLTVNSHEIFAVTNSEGNPNETVLEMARLPIPQLSKEAKFLLQEASKDPHGHILHLSHLGGTSIQVNDQNVVEGNDRRTLALWEGAIEELEAEGLIRPTSYKREIYELTRLGYEVADQL